MNEKPTENHDEEQYDYFDYLEAMYGHGFVSKDSELMYGFEPVEINHFIDSENQDEQEFPEDVPQRDFDELVQAYEDRVRGWATEKVGQIESEKYNEGSLYFSSVPEKLKKAFEYATEMLRKIAHKNGGYIEVDDGYNPTWNMATIRVIGRGMHFENDDDFRLLLRFFGFVEITYRDDNELAVTFVRPDYFEVKEVKL